MKTNRSLKSKSTSVRLDRDLEKPINEWLQHNSGFNFTSLINLAVRRFISQKQVLEPVEITEANDHDVTVIADKMILKHAHMLKKLK